MKKLFLVIASVCALAFGLQSCTAELKGQLSDLETRVSKLEKSVTALQQYTDLLEALNSGDFVVGVTQHTNSYELKFYSGKTVIISNGKDGKDGANGADGKDGKDGVTPKFKIENETWYVSYDNGATWTAVGSAIDRSLFQDVALEGDTLVITLADGTIVTVPVQVLANIETLVAKAGEYEVEGVVDNAASTVTIKCSPKVLDAMTQAKLVVTATAGSTTNVDPEATYDLVQGVQVIVTAPNGKEHAYAVTAIKGTAQITKVWDKKDAINYPGVETSAGAIAFSGTNIVRSDNKVYDLELNYIGDVNMTGISGDVVTITNDESGILTEFFWVREDLAEFWAWFDGYDKPATKIWDIEAGSCAHYGSISGDYNTGAVLCSRAAVNGENQKFHTILVKKGVEAYAWAFLETNLCGTDGNWGTMVSACNYDENKWGAVDFVIWDSYPGGARVYKKVGTRVDTPLVEITNTLNGNGWGNYTIGSVRSFQWEGENYAAVTTSGWPCAYFSVVKVSDSSFVYDSETLASYPAPVAGTAYVYDQANDCAYMAVGVAPGEATGVVLYRLGY